MSTTTITTKCQCGKNSFSCETPTSELPLLSYFCHCNSCRHATGTLAFMGCLWPGMFPRNLEHCSAYAFSENGNIMFCSTCGTWLLCQASNGDHRVTLRSLTTPARWCKLVNHNFVNDTIDGGLATVLKQVQGHRLRRFAEHHEGEELDDQWTGRALTEADLEEDELKAHCKCGGVSFTITRPNEVSTSLALDPTRASRKMGCWWLSPDRTKYTAVICTCHTCSSATGNDCMASCFIPISQMRLEDGSPMPSPPLFGTMKEYESSEKSKRYFCGTCSATAFRILNNRQQVPHVAVGLLDAASGARAEGWLNWMKDGISNYHDRAARGLLADDLRKSWANWRESANHR